MSGINTYNILIIGINGTGKSTFLKKIPKVDNDKLITHQLKFDTTVFHVDVGAGELSEGNIEDFSAILAFFSFNSPETLSWVMNTLKNNKNNIPAILCGNKSDLSSLIITPPTSYKYYDVSIGKSNHQKIFDYLVKILK